MASTKHRLIMVGPPGAGKGTQAEKLANNRGWAHISTGEMLRSAVASKSDLGLRVSEYLDRGDLVPDELVIGLVKERITWEDSQKGYVLDGFPRNLEQAKALDIALIELEEPITRVFYFNVPREELVNRILSRAASGSGRSDDNREVIENRLRVYEEQTAPLINFYREKGVLVEIEGFGTVEEVEKLISERI